MAQMPATTPKIDVGCPDVTMCVGFERRRRGSRGTWSRPSVSSAASAFFDGEISLPAFETIIQSLEVASLPFYPASLTLQTYISAYPTDSSAALLQAVRDENHNIFLDLFRNGILKEIEREKPDIVGISIPSMPQMLAGMTLAYLVKRRGSGLPCDRRRAAHQYAAR